MSDKNHEIPLSGGNVNSGVVRVGNTVRRATSAHSDGVHRLLNHLEKKGFAHAPHLLGVDEKGREILSYIPGSTDFPPNLWENEPALVAAVRMLRDYHEAVADFEVSKTDSWAFVDPDPERREIICHNDFAPYNMVFTQGIPTGIFDFDLAGPGPKLRDVAYLAYWLVPLSFSSTDMASFSAKEVAGNLPRLRVLCETYGTRSYLPLLNMVSEVLAHMGNFEAAEKMIGTEAAQKLEEGGHFAHWNREFRAFKAMLPRIRQQLTQM